MSITAQRFFAGKHAALHCIQGVLKDAVEIRIATAYFESSGYQDLQDTLRGKRIRLLVGRPEGGEDKVRLVLDEFIGELSQGSQERRTQAMRQLLEALEEGWMTVAVGETPSEDTPWVDARYLYHHAKLYIADTSTAVVTSANMSHHGLCTSREAGITVTNQDDVAYFVERFDYYFDKARSITDQLIEELKAWLQAYDPYTIYARALLELYGLPQEESPAQLPPLAEYQKGVVSSVLRSLMEHDGAFLVASTGLGKTIIAAHIAAYLRMQGEIETAIVIGPAGLREVWRRWMRAARVSSVEFSYHTLTRKDGDSNLPILLHELGMVNRQTLIILDESHRLRNEEGNGGDLRLSNERIQRAVQESGGRVLLLTATPYGKAFSEVESQLNLLPPPKQARATSLGFTTEVTAWQVEKLSDLPELPTCTVLTTPDVVQHFGEVDETEARFVRFATEKRYFPRRIRLATIRYENPFDDFFADLLSSKLLYKKVAQPDGSLQALLPLDINGQGERLALQEALFLHQFCSSTAEVDRVCGLLERGGYSYDFARQAELREFIRVNRKIVRRVKHPSNDPKLGKLKKIIEDAAEQKIVVFCEYHETAKHLKAGLGKLLPELSVDTTVETQNLDLLLQRFAPEANEVLPEARDPENEIQVLIATRAMAEGFNLQDASILVNYDLPWTVLQLAQRMGRILRPWRVPRDVTVYNFVPSTMDHAGIRHARNWKDRLHERSRQHRSLAQIPVMVYEESRKANWNREYEMEKLGREMYLAGEDYTDMDLQEVLEFLQTTDDLTTSTFYNDLALIENREEILSLPPGIRSAMKASGKKRLFLLLKRGRNHIDTVLADNHGVPLAESWRREDIMRAIRCLPETPKASFDLYPNDDEFDAWIENTREKWAKQMNIQPYQMKVLCALALV
jgi:superfamily II DNA or RNA helicase